MKRILDFFYRTARKIRYTIYPPVYLTAVTVLKSKDGKILHASSKDGNSLIRLASKIKFTNIER